MLRQDILTFTMQCFNGSYVYQSWYNFTYFVKLCNGEFQPVTLFRKFTFVSSRIENENTVYTDVYVYVQTLMPCERYEICMYQCLAIVFHIKEYSVK